MSSNGCFPLVMDKVIDFVNGEEDKRTVSCAECFTPMYEAGDSYACFCGFSIKMKKIRG